jgi:hypothetical protein
MATPRKLPSSYLARIAQFKITAKNNTVEPAEQAQFSAIIDGILASANLETISAKQVRKDLAEKIGVDLSDKKVRMTFTISCYSAGECAKLMYCETASSQIPNQRTLRPSHQNNPRHPRPHHRTYKWLPHALLQAHTLAKQPRYLDPRLRQERIRRRRVGCHK